MNQLALLRAPEPPSVEGIDLRCCDVTEVLAEVRGARLIHADPPWRYAREAGAANPESHGIYGGLPETEIVAHLDAAYACAGHACRLACWYTWPKDAEWRSAGQAGPRWGERVTGGAWVKTGQVGVGYHWRGQSEPVAVYTRGSTGRPPALLLNAYVSDAGDHSEKPVEWLRQWLCAWTAPGDSAGVVHPGRLERTHERHDLRAAFGGWVAGRGLRGVA